MRVQLRIKRAIDMVTAAVALVILSPVLGVVGLFIRVRMGPPVLFRQLRPGHEGRPFCLYKFRTMTMDRDQDGRLLPTHQRLTPFGRWLRNYSVDEIPQLWNVLKGDMSLIGPRPLLMSYLDKYTPDQARRHDVRPGITGLAQVSGRQDIPFSRRLELDTWYVDNWSLLLDLRILTRTISLVLRTTGVRPGQDVREVDDLGLNLESQTKDSTRDFP